MARTKTDRPGGPGDEYDNRDTGDARGDGRDNTDYDFGNRDNTGTGDTGTGDTGTGTGTTGDGRDKEDNKYGDGEYESNTGIDVTAGATPGGGGGGDNTQDTRDNVPPPDNNRYDVTYGDGGRVGPGSGIADPTMPGLLEMPGNTWLGNPPQRTVQEEELASYQLNQLLAGDSEYMRQARMEGLETGGGLGGTMGIRAALGEAIRRGGPIAIADAQAYRDAAAQNMDVLAQFGLANIQRQTQLELGVMDANTRITTQQMQNQTMTNIARMEDLRAREIANADNETRMEIARINAEIQRAIANDNYNYNLLLNQQQQGWEESMLDYRQANELELIAARGEYNLAGTELQIYANEQQTYTTLFMNSYEAALDRLDSLNGLDIDEAARQRATDAIWEGFYASIELLAALYPGATPIEFEGQ